MAISLTSKLDAVNSMLIGIGEAPVNTMNSGLQEAEIAALTLDTVSREVQTAGWAFNTDLRYTLSRNSANHISVPSNCLYVDTVALTRDYDTAAAHINIVPDGNLTLQSTGNIYLTPSTGNITLYDSGNSDDYVRMDIDANGGLEISTVDASGAGNADLTLDIMGNILLEAPVFMKETSAAATDITANGQLWVKDVNPNELWFTNDTGTDIQLTSGDQPNIRTAVITITEAEMDDLHNTPKELVAAGGPADVIIPVHVTAFVDRDASTAQTGSLDFMIGWNGANTLSQGVWMYYKRFMFHEGGDRTLQFATVTEVSQSHQDAMGDNLTATTNGAITSGSIDAVRVVVQYYVYDNG